MLEVWKAVISNRASESTMNALSLRGLRIMTVGTLEGVK
jgi:hypothetical protein